MSINFSYCKLKSRSSKTYKFVYMCIYWERYLYWLSLQMKGRERGNFLSRLKKPSSHSTRVFLYDSFSSWRFSVAFGDLKVQKIGGSHSFPVFAKLASSEKRRTRNGARTYHAWQHERKNTPSMYRNYTTNDSWS